MLGFSALVKLTKNFEFSSVAYIINHLFDERNLHFLQNDDSWNDASLQTGDEMDVEDVQVVWVFVPSEWLRSVIESYLT